MIVTHPDNLSRIKAIMPTVAIGDGPAVPIDAIEIRTDPFIEPTRKTGRLIWPKDPFVTYEESDRSWGLALGIAVEEEAAVFWTFAMPPNEIEEIFRHRQAMIEEKFFSGDVVQWRPIVRNPF